MVYKTSYHWAIKVRNNTGANYWVHVDMLEMMTILHIKQSPTCKTENANKRRPINRVNILLALRPQMPRTSGSDTPVKNERISRGQLSFMIYQSQFVKREEKKEKYFIESRNVRERE